MYKWLSKCLVQLCFELQYNCYKDTYKFRLLVLNPCLNEKFNQCVASIFGPAYDIYPRGEANKILIVKVIFNAKVKFKK